MKYREYDGKRRDRADERREPGRDRAGKKYEFGRNGAGEKCELGRDRASKKYEFGRGRADEKYESGRDRAGEKYEFGRKRANERREPGRAGMHSYGEPGYPVGEEICEESSRIVEGRNAVIEAFRSGREIDRVLILDGCQDGPIQTIRREAKKHGTVVDFVKKERLEQLSVTGMHQGVIAYAAACEYSTVEAILDSAKAKGEPPFLFLLDNIEDPHNLGAIIRTANLVGAHGVIIPKRRAVGLTATVARTSAGALNYTPVARVTNLGNTIEELKKEGIWFVCADMGAEPMYRQNLTGPIGLVIGNEGEGVSRLVKEKCDFVASIPMKGNIDSLNASVAAGVLAYEILRQRDFKGV